MAIREQELLAAIEGIEGEVSSKTGSPLMTQATARDALLMVERIAIDLRWILQRQIRTMPRG